MQAVLYKRACTLASTSAQTGMYTCKHFYTNWHVHVQALLHKLVCTVHVKALLRKMACAPASTSTQIEYFHTNCKHFYTNRHVHLQALQHKLACTHASTSTQTSMYTCKHLCTNWHVHLTPESTSRQTGMYTCKYSYKNLHVHFTPTSTRSIVTLLYITASAFRNTNYDDTALILGAQIML
jgi:hypothetical protein